MAIDPLELKAITKEELAKSGISTTVDEDSVGNAFASIIADINTPNTEEVINLQEGFLPSVEEENQYTQRYNEMFAVPEDYREYARDYTNENVFIALDNGVAKDITIDGSGFYIPEGTRIYSSVTNRSVVVVSKVYMNPEDSVAYVPVISEESFVNIPANSLDSTELSLFEIDNVDPAKAENISLYSGNTKALVVTSRELSDADKRYYRTHAGKAIGGCNIDAIELELVSLPGVARYRILKGNYGPSVIAVLIEPEDLTLAAETVEIVENALNQSAALGSRVVVKTPILREIMIDIEIDETVSAENKAAIISEASQYVNNLRAGETFKASYIIDLIKAKYPNSKPVVTKIYVDWREHTSTNIITPRDKEKLVITSGEAIRFT